MTPEPTHDIPSPAELASIADDLEKQTESVNQLESLVIEAMLSIKATREANEHNKL